MFWGQRGQWLHGGVAVLRAPELHFTVKMVNLMLCIFCHDKEHRTEGKC